MVDLSAAIAKQVAEEGIEIKKLPLVPGRRVHIDGDYLAYYTGAPDMDPGIARMTTANLIQKMQDMTGAESAVVHLTSSGSHKGERYLIATVKPYQNQRGGDKPKNWKCIRDYLEGYTGEDFTKKVWATREADDGIATVAQFAVDNNKLDAIATADKDLRMLPGIHVNWQTYDLVTVPGDAFSVIGGTREKPLVYGTKWFWLQMLQGDPTDTIPGLEYIWEQVKPGGPERMNKCGPKTAERHLMRAYNDAEALEIVRSHYARTYRTDGDDRLVEQAGLLWLRRDRTAPVDDFRRSMGHLFDDALHGASDRLVERVRLRRSELDALSE